MHTLVLSDIHLGNGDGYDIFAGADVLPGVLAAAAAARSRVILNGDSFDFLMNEDPLELSEARAAEQARAIVRHRDSAAVLAGLGDVLAAGGSVEIRLGNHDAEIALPAVQEVLREGLGQPPEIARKLVFTRGDAPGKIEVNGARVLLAHGEHNDPWNRLDYTNLGDPAKAGAFHYPPGSNLVKTLLNPLKRRFGMRFADLLKPDFQGGVLTVLAVDPGALRLIFQGSTAKLLWHLMRRLDESPSFDQEANTPEAQALEQGHLAAAIDQAGLTPDEREALIAAIDPQAAQVHFGLLDGGLFGNARLKLARAGLRMYAAAQRALAGDVGEQFFTLEPGEAEWTEARRLADKFDVDAVVLGHTHAARFKHEGDLTYVNTGTWIYLMSLPAADAGDDAWTTFLQQCRENPGLDPARGPAPQLTTRLTGLVLDPDPAGGAVARLTEWSAGGASSVLGETRIVRRR
jgi:predicted phosphodiesterase